MSKAEKLFEELGYKKEKRKYGFIYYGEYKLIGFNYLSRTVNINAFITIQELNAINKQVKELKWN